MKKRVYDEAFKVMAVWLSESKGSIRAAADELDIDPGRISKCKHLYKGGGSGIRLHMGLTEALNTTTFIPFGPLYTVRLR